MRRPWYLLTTLLVGLVVEEAVASVRMGWHHGGAGHAQRADPPIPGAEGTRVRWQSKTDSPSNASPVAFGDGICITEEPNTLSCFDAEDGRFLWSASNRYPDTLEGSARAEVQALFDQADEDARRIEGLLEAVSVAQAEARFAVEPGPRQVELERLSKELSAVRMRLERLAELRPPVPRWPIGTATPTPVVGEDGIFALFGNGVVSRFSQDGARQWSIWLERSEAWPADPDFGATASPLWVDGVLVVAYERLRGIEPATGRQLWEGPPYRSYATPAVVRLGDRAIIVTPHGDLVDVRSGALVGQAPISTTYSSPVALGSRVFTIGTVGRESASRATQARAFQLERHDDDSVAASLLWERKLSKENTFATPLVTEARIYTIDMKGELEVLAPEDGRRLSRTPTRLFAIQGSPSPTAAGGRVYLGWDGGKLAAFSDADEPESLGTMATEPHLPTPLFVGSRIYIRGDESLICIE
jgi:outer membrane protein assembly factor BamB